MKRIFSNHSGWYCQWYECYFYIEKHFTKSKF